MFASDSQVTLVNPRPPIELISGKKSVLNTVLYRDGRPYISISTLDAAVSCTHIMDLITNKLLATIQRRTILPDTIKFEQRYDGEKLKVKDWLRVVDPVHPHSKWLVSTEIGNFIWKIDPVYRVALYPENDLEHPIAWIRQEETSVNAAYLINHEAESFVDEVVGAFVILEQQLREAERMMAVFSSKPNFWKATGVQKS